MTAQDGTPTNAVFGFTRLLLNVIRDCDPERVAILFDRKEPTFRHEIYDQYKANRPEPPDDLKPQFALCREAAQRLGIPSIDRPGYEADDLIGTLAKGWTEVSADKKCVIVTADKDMMQLVNGQISIWDGKEKYTDIESVKEKFGVYPELVAEVLGLAGDSSDNIPGVPGIGVKTAATLLNEHGGLEPLLAAAPTIKGKRGQNLVEFADDARMSTVLATINCEVEINIPLDDLVLRSPEPAPLADFLRALNFRRFLKEFGLDDVAPTGPKIERDDYLTVTTEGDLTRLIEEIKTAGRLSLDLETTSLSTLDAEIVGVAIAWDIGKAAYIPLGHTYEGAPVQLSPEYVLAELRPLIEDPEFPIIGQNLKYEWQVLRQAAGIQLSGVVCDTMLAAYLVEPGRRVGLDTLSEDLLGHRMISYGEVTGGDKDPHGFAHVDLGAATRYAAEDADIALRLADLLMPQLEEAGLESLARDVELPLAELLARVEHNGIRVDVHRLREQSVRYEVRLQELADEIHGLAEGPFNIDSPKQLAGVLFDDLGLPVEKRTKTGPSTDATVLAKLADIHPLPSKVLEYRHLRKLKNTYLDTLPDLVHPETGRVHTSFRQAVTATGRLSSSEPNLQNIPIRTPEGREIRRAFIPEAGWKMMSVDYSQIELRLLAHCSQDPGLIESFCEGADIHRRTAAQVFGVTEDEVTGDQRRQAKSVNFGLMYGMSAFRLSNELKIPQGDARRLIKRYFEQYSGVKAYFESAVASAKETKKATTLMGRTRRLPQINSSSFNIRQQSERLAINTPIQGSAADILKVAMLRVDKRIREHGAQCRMLLTVHDELVFEMPPEELDVLPDLIKEEMEASMSLSVPLLVEIGIGDNWAEIH